MRHENWSRFVPKSLAVILAGFGATNVLGQDVGPQIRVDQTGAIAGNETTVAASDVNPDEVIAGWNDYRPGTDCCRSGFSLSLDGGQTWTGFLIRPPAGRQASVEGDPMSAFDRRTGTLWAGAIAFSGNGGVYVARKDPGDSTFQPTVMASAPGADKCWMVAGPRPGNQDTTRVYIAYSRGIIWSDDMGQTWTSPRSLGSGIGFLPRVGPDGEVYVAYWDFGRGMLLKRSLNGGGSFTTHTIATRMDTWGTQDGSRFPGIFRVPPLVYIDVDQNTGTLFAVYFDTTNIVNGQRNVDLYFTKSTNQGTTWSTPVVINNDNNPPGDQFFSFIEIDSTGRIHIVFNDSRNTVQNDGVTNGMFDVYHMFSEDEGATWTEHRLTPNSWNSANDGVRGAGQFIGDYLGMAIGQNKVYPVYLDTTPGTSRMFTNVITFGTNVSLTGIRVTFGQRISGNLQSVRTSDDEFYVAQSEFFYDVREPNISEVQVSGIVSGSPASLDVVAEGHISVPNGVTTVRLRNFDTNEWDDIGSFPIGTTETVGTVNVPNPAPYIRNSDRRIRVRLKTVVIAPLTADGFQQFWDQIVVADGG